MSLFERIQNKRYDLQEASSGGKSKGSGPRSTNFNKNNKNKKTDKFEDITGEGIKKGDYPKTRKKFTMSPNAVFSMTCDKVDAKVRVKEDGSWEILEITGRDVAAYTNKKVYE